MVITSFVFLVSSVVLLLLLGDGAGGSSKCYTLLLRKHLLQKIIFIERVSYGKFCCLPRLGKKGVTISVVNVYYYVLAVNILVLNHNAV